MLKPVGGWLLKNIVPVGIALILVVSHWWAYDSGQEDIEQKYAAQQSALIAENARLSEYNRTLSQALATAQTAARINNERRNANNLNKVTDYVKANPKAPECNLTDADAKFLQELLGEGNPDAD
jgi:hypothetical protein